MTTVAKFFYARDDGEVMPLGEYAVPALPRCGERVRIDERKRSYVGRVTAVDHVLTPPAAEVHVVLKLTPPK